MRWLLHEHDFYWPTMRKYCIDYAKVAKDARDLDLSLRPQLYKLSTFLSLGSSEDG